MKVLVLSSRSVYWSANLGLDICASLQSLGHRVDYISPYKYSNMPSYALSIYDNENQPVPSVRLSVITWIKKNIFYRLNAYYRRLFHCNPLVVKDELSPKIPVPDLISALPDREYDCIVTIFLEDYFVSSTFKALSDRFKCPMILLAVDMYLMTGGCNYYGRCKKFKKECRSCPAEKFLPKYHNRAYKNFIHKREVLSTINYAIALNDYMKGEFVQANIFDKSRIYHFLSCINETTFKPENKNIAREKLGLPKDDFIMFAGAANLKTPRKGAKVLMQAVEKFVITNGSQKLLLVFAGRNKMEGFSTNIPIVNLGFLSMKKLALMYVAADVYLSPSLEDAGPSMVNQALMAGCPVVSFNIGVAKEVVINGETGYCAQYNDPDDFANGINQIYLSESPSALRKHCREIALRYFSLAACGERLQEIYERLVNREIGIN